MHLLPTARLAPPHIHTRPTLNLHGSVSGPTVELDKVSGFSIIVSGMMAESIYTCTAVSASLTLPLVEPNAT